MPGGLLFQDRNAANGTKQTLAVNVYGYTITLNPAKTLSGITLPNNTHVNVLAMNVASAASVAPAAPQSLTAAAQSSSQIALAWSDSTAPTSFTLQVRSKAHSTQCPLLPEGRKTFAFRFVFLTTCGDLDFHQARR